MDNQRDTQNENMPLNSEYQEYEDRQLKSLLDEAETDSENYFAIVDELTRRGYSVVSEEDAEDADLIDDAEDAPLSPATHPKKKKAFSALCNRLWIVLTALISLAGGSYFLYEQNQFIPIQNAHILIMLAIVFALISLSYLMVGIRMAVNRLRGFVSRSCIWIEYWILTALWSAIGIYQLYNTVNSFMIYYRYGFGVKPAALVAAPMLVFVAFALLLALSFSYLAEELRNQ